MSKKTIRITRESIIQSIINDTYTFGCICFTFWFNYKFINGNNFIDVFLLLCIVCVPKIDAIKYYGVNEKKLKKIQQIIEEKENENI